MAVVPQVAKLRLEGSATPTNFRQWLVTAEALNSAAGAPVNITIDQTTGGIPPSGATALQLRLRRMDAGAVRTWSLAPTAVSQTVTAYLTDTGLVDGAPRAGTLELELDASRQELGVTVWNVSTDGSPNSPPTGYTSVLDRGWIRSTTSAVLTPSLLTAAYPDTVTLTADLAAPGYVSQPLTLALGPDSGTTPAATDGHTRAVSVDNTFPVASTVYTPTITVPNATLTGEPWTLLTVTTQDVTVDPRISFATRLFQRNDGAWATPPGSTPVGDRKRLTAELGFLAERATNSWGEGVNGITYTRTLRDRGQLVPAISESRTTQHQGGEAGWAANFLRWESQLPGGIWDWTVTVTAPADAVGLETNTAAEVVLLARNPAYAVIVGAAPYGTADGRHFQVGDALLVGVGVVDYNTRCLIPADTDDPPTVMLARFTDAGAVQYLQDDLITWTVLADGAQANEIALARADTVIPGANPNVWVRVISGTLTAQWTNPAEDFFVLGQAIVSGTPYQNFVPSPLVTPDAHAPTTGGPPGPPGPQGPPGPPGPAGSARPGSVAGTVRGGIGATVEEGGVTGHVG